MRTKPQVKRCKGCKRRVPLYNSSGYCRICYRNSEEFKKKKRDYFRKILNIPESGWRKE